MSIPESTAGAAAAVPSSRWPALLEVLSLPVLGMVVAFLIAAVLGVSMGNPLVQLTPETLPDSWLPLAAQLLKLLLLQYGGLLLLAAVLLLPRRELTLKRFGLSANGFAWRRLLGMGLLLACLLVPLQIALLGADARWDLGDTAPWRRALLDAPRTADFWLLMAIGSFGLVPLFEEWFYRAILQGRLQQVMPPGHAIVLVSTLFVLGHSQYHEPNLINIATALFVFGSSLVFGWLYWKTGSIWPGVVLHAAVNTPWPNGALALVLIAALLMSAALTHRHWRPWLGELGQMLRPRALGRALLAPLLVTIVFGVGMTKAGNLILLAAALMLAVGLVWRWRIRQKGSLA